MAKLFDTADAERLIQEHRMMLEELDEIAQYEDNVQIDIEKAANLVVTRNVLDVLRDMLLRPRQLSGNISSSSAQAPQTARVQTGLTGTLTTIP